MTPALPKNTYEIAVCADSPRTGARHDLAHGAADDAVEALAVNRSAGKNLRKQLLRVEHHQTAVLLTDIRLGAAEFEDGKETVAAVAVRENNDRFARF